MKTFEGIPEDDFNELCELMGREKAIKYIEKNHGNYRAVVTKLLILKFKVLAKNHPISFWGIFILVLSILFFFIYETVSY